MAHLPDPVLKGSSHLELDSVNQIDTFSRVLLSPGSSSKSSKMGKPNILLGFGLILVLVSSSFVSGSEEDAVPESGVIFTEPSVDLVAPWDATTTPTPSTTTIMPKITEPDSKVGVAEPSTAAVISSFVSAPVVPVSTDKVPPLAAATSIRSKVPPSFRNYINEIRNTAAEIRWIKRDTNPGVETTKQQIHPVNVSTTSAPPPEVVTTQPSSPHPRPPLPTLPVPPINAISAIIRDLEKQKRDYESIKDVHPKLHLIPQQYFVPKPKPRLELQQRPLSPIMAAGQETLTQKVIKSSESVPAAVAPIASGPVPEPSGGDVGSWSGNGRWLWSWLGLGGDDGSKSVSSTPYPYPHPPLGGGTEQPHPPAGQGFKYDCPFPHPETKTAQKRSWFLF